MYGQLTTSGITKGSTKHGPEHTMFEFNVFYFPIPSTAGGARVSNLTATGRIPY